ncbi:MAG: hypothetical protein JWL77_1450 [Chthonomonadaceae bacterium]|nr:hypothetical protein [Chthonomonadaceae bacterium]
MQPAGSIVLTIPAGVAIGADPTNFGSYPVVIPIVVNLTGGKIPCQGNFTVTFTGNTGANSLTGSMTLTRDNVTFDLDLGLDNQLNVSGAITVKEGGATIQAMGITTDANAAPVFLQSATAAMQKLPGVTKPFLSGVFSTVAMNNSGQIVGTGQITVNGKLQTTAFLLTPK